MLDADNLAKNPDEHELQQQALALVNYLSRHLVCLGINYIALDGDGADSSSLRR